MKKITLNGSINFFMFLYIISLYLLTYRVGLNLISNGLAAILIALIWINIIVKRIKIVFNKFLFFHGLFIIICSISVFYAFNQGISFTKVKTLVQIYVVMISLINYVDTFEKLYKLMKYFAYSGVIASVYILLNADFTNITRFGSELGNVNAVGMILGISSVFSFYFILEEKEYQFSPMLLANSIVILLTGSRKSLMFLIFTLLVLLFSKRDKRIRSKVKFFLLGAVLLSIAVYVIYNVPIFYQIIGRRMDNLLDFAFGEGTTERSMNIRFMMIQLGWDWFKERPITGYGINNYRLLLGQEIGWITYSHNNIIELLVGIGIIGAIVYYLEQIIVMKGLLKASKFAYRSLMYSFIAIIFGYIFMSVGLVYYDSKHISIILAVGSVINRISKKEKNISFAENNEVRKENEK